MDVSRTRDLITRRMSDPSARIVYTSGGRANAIRRPSGDQVGVHPSVSRSAPLPSGRTRETYWRRGSDSWNAIQSPVGDQRGHIGDPSSPRSMRLATVPSSRMRTSAWSSAS